MHCNLRSLDVILPLSYDAHTKFEETLYVLEGAPHPAVRVRGITPRKFLKTQMLNRAFW